MKRVVFLDSALLDQSEIVDYIARSSNSLEVARRFMRKIYAHCDRLANLPFEMGVSCPELAPGLRSTTFQNYVIFFRYAEDRFEVINILEGHRDIPEYFSPSTPE